MKFKKKTIKKRKAFPEEADYFGSPYVIEVVVEAVVVVVVVVIE